ncbi:PEP-CTERM/exosortase system-associated acyltransferase [Alteromonas pelagimontana]|uniref:PEP-CTERM/exosortase system-associated acyltransferase n=1 Tax=Alteromonas pelagimontana TaxID=1858656 RepID=A0A6M4MHQ1_9ALTE|nr:PEP-CTERM/exosortase system-associated acyltransferase [Alteromonas pelagimontana]QJR82537.1 PEP-CTERM/exosortase system-associated acyltransferase [Alteromonas pelagimontana]
MKRRLLNAFKKVHQVPGIKQVLRPVIRRKVNKAIDAAASHFFEHFTLVVAHEEDEQRVCFRTRHQVYCEELGFEQQNKTKMEYDEFDEYALSCYIKHKATGDCAGTVRLVMPQHPGQVLPLEHNCPEAIRIDDHSPQRYPRQTICEISRLAIPKRFRRRQSDNSLSPVTGKSLHKGFRKSEPGRNFPYLSLALYFFAASICVLRDIENVYVMMEPKLARGLKMLGINFQQLGHEIEYHGQRAAYQLSPEEFMQQISPALQRFQRKIMQELEEIPNFGAIFRHQPSSLTQKDGKQRRAA